MKRVAVLGGGPAGAFAAERLASSGFETVLFDEKLAWEKPCGGGLTYKACQRYPFLLENDFPKRYVTETALSAEGAGAVRLALREPVVIFSRVDLNRLLLDRAERAGARIEQKRVLEAVREGAVWKVRTASGTVEADFCILATGARNTLRNLGTQFGQDEILCATGYYVPGDQAHIDLHFYPKWEGYIWVFPRCGHRSVGICGRGMTVREQRARLEAFMRERGIETGGARFYAHVLPSLGVNGWQHNRVAGEGWMAVGDAAGLVDPITGEGIYYSLRSADLAVSALTSNLRDAELVYPASLRSDFADDLEYGAALAKRMFLGSYLGKPICQRMVQLLRYSATYREVVADLFDGMQSYRGLKPRLVESIKPILLEAATGWMRPTARVVPDAGSPRR